MALYLPTTCAIFEPCANTESFTGPPAKVGLGGYSPPPPTFLLSKKQMTQLKMKMNTNLVSTKFFFFLLPTNHSKTMLFLIVS